MEPREHGQYLGVSFQFDHNPGCHQGPISHHMLQCDRKMGHFCGPKEEPNRFHIDDLFGFYLIPVVLICPTF